MKSITIFIVLVTLTMLVAGCNKEIAVVTAYNLSDQNWTLGVAKNWAGFFVKNTDDNKKGTNTKMVQGQKCAEYIVKNTEENTQITYWMVSGKYDQL